MIKSTKEVKKNKRVRAVGIAYFSIVGDLHDL